MPQMLKSCLCFGYATSKRPFTSTARSSLLKVTSLKSRKVLRLSGKDTLKFLQGMVTNNVELLNSHPLIYAGFLNAPGRILYDVFLHRSPESTSTVEEVLIDHHESATQSLAAHLKRFILRSKVKITDVSSEYSIYSVISPLESPSSSSVEDLVQHQDPRTRSMGYRFLLPSALNVAVRLPSSEEVTMVGETEYDLHRLRLGVAEGPVDLVQGQSIPLESNLDRMGAIDFRKGCYVGQELTARTHHTGVTRKRIVPVRLFREDEPPPMSLIPTTFLNPLPVPAPSDFSPPQPQSDLRPLTSKVAKPRPAGRLGSTIVVGSPSCTEEKVAIGLALVRLEQMELDDGMFALEGGWRAKGFIPDWWSDREVELGRQRK